MGEANGMHARREVIQHAVGLTTLCRPALARILRVHTDTIAKVAKERMCGGAHVIHASPGFEHGNARRSPYNITSPELTALIESHIELNTFPPADDCVLRRIYPGKNGWNGLHRQDARRSVPFETFRAVGLRYLDREGLKSLLRVHTDHNVCPTCKFASLAKDELQLRIRATTPAGAEEDLQALHLQLQLVVDQLSAHKEAVYHQDSYLERLLSAATSARAAVTGAGAPMIRPCAMAVHFDAAAGRQVPHTALETGDESMCGYRVTAGANLSSPDANVFCPEVGSGKSGSSGALINQILFHFLKWSEGKRLLIVVSNTHTQQERAAFSFRARFLFFPSASTGPSPAPAQRRLEAELRCSLPGACALTGQPARCSAHWTPCRLMAPRRSRRSSRLVAWRDTAAVAGVVQGQTAMCGDRPAAQLAHPRTATT